MIINFHFRKLSINEKNEEVEDREENRILSNLDHAMDLKGKFSKCQLLLSQNTLQINF